MTTYVINYSDPLRDPFTIAPGGFNGPGGGVAASTLRFYGRGALEWGEAVNENMLRSLENFNGATPPPVAIDGQLWYRAQLYWRDTTGVTWSRWNFDTSSWDDITLDVTEAVSAPLSPSIGDYWYDTVNGILFRWDQYVTITTGGSSAPDWLERYHGTAAGAPPATPVQDLVIWDSFAADWISAVDITALGGLLADGSVPMSGDLDLGTFNIINLADPVNPQDAVTLAYADANYLLLDASNDPMTADLTLFPNGAYPQANSDIAATITYVNSAAASVTGGSASIFTTGSVSHKPGDIYVNTGTARIWIAVTTATSAPTFFASDGSDTNWKQVFPALYS